MTTPYVTQRDAILVHAKAAALAANPKWTNVSVGLPTFVGSKGVRLFYGGEAEPEYLGTSSTLSSEEVAQRVQITAWWSLASLNETLAKAIEAEVATFVHELRTRLDANARLGGVADTLRLDYADPDIVVVGGTRFLVIDAVAIVDYTEYTKAAGS